MSKQERSHRQRKTSPPSAESRNLASLEDKRQAAIAEDLRKVGIAVIGGSFLAAAAEKVSSWLVATVGMFGILLWLVGLWVTGRKRGGP